MWFSLKVVTKKFLSLKTIDITRFQDLAKTLYMVYK
jgi:hypothetical protein